MATDENIFKILVATDIHLGYNEKNPARGDDSFVTFEEILSLAEDNEVDFILLGGDLFHENKPSRQCLMKCMNLLRHYCMGDRPVNVEFLSDPSENFRHCHFPGVNYMDPNLNISIPVFSIHGNHDDPSGLGQYSVLDMLSSSGLVNYFGKCTDLKDIRISPILLKKGKTKLALYGLSYIKDERLYRLFREGKVVKLRPKMCTEEWFNVFVLHQNRVKHGPTSYIPDEFLDNFLDLVIWGHEHECRIKPEWSKEQAFFITQPGSSVATSLCDGEAAEKYVALLKIHGKTFKLEPLKLETVRPFVFDTILLSDCTGLAPDMDKPSEQVEIYVEEHIQRLLARAEGLKTGHEKQPQLPLVRLRVEYSNEQQMFNSCRFGQRFQEQIINPEDVILFRKERPKETTKKESGIDQEAMESVLPNDPNFIWGTRVETLVEKYFKEAEEKKQLQLLTESGIGEAVMRFIDKDDKDAIKDIVEHQIRKTCIYLRDRDVDEDNIEEEVDSFRQERLQRMEEDVQETRATLAAASRARTSDGMSDGSEEEISGMEEAPVVTRGRGRGQRGGRGRGKASGDGDAAGHNTASSGRGRGRGSRGNFNRGRSAGRRSAVNDGTSQSIIQAFAAQSSQRSTASRNSRSKKITYEESDNEDSNEF